jgi:hypothetical protein
VLFEHPVHEPSAPFLRALEQWNDEIGLGRDVLHEGMAKLRKCFIKLAVNGFTLQHPASQHPALVQVHAKLVVLGDEPCASGLGVHDWTYSQAPSQADRPNGGEITKIVRDQPARPHDARGSE